jgi:hypothetical protein
MMAEWFDPDLVGATICGNARPDRHVPLMWQTRISE